jgi:hypothetical protein
VQWGPQPYEALLDLICQSFQCRPSQAKQEDWYEVRAVLDARAAADAAGASRSGTLKDNPGLQAVYARMVQAQTGQEPGESSAFDELLAALDDETAEDEE